MSRAAFVGASDFGRRQADDAVSTIDGAPSDPQPNEHLTGDAVEALLARWLSEPRRRGRTNRVYRLYDRLGVLLYVGVTCRGAQRLHEHAMAKNWWGSVARVTWDVYPSRAAALRAETQAIWAEVPIHNIQRPKVREEMPPPSMPGRGVKGVRDDGRRGSVLTQGQVWDALERQARRYFATDAVGLIAEFEEGAIPRTDPRLRFVVNLLSALRLEDGS